MNIYEAIGMTWIILTSALATVGILFLAFVGLRVSLNGTQEAKNGDVPVEVKEMFKVAR